MDYAVTFALLSLVFAGMNDLVFKFYSGKNRSRGAYVFGIGVIWTALQVIAVAAHGDAFTIDRTTVGFGLVAGLVLTLSNILLIESLAHIDVSLGSMIYRLNTIGVVILSFLFLGEPLGGLKILGVLCGVAGVLLLYRGVRSPEHDGRFLLFFGAAVVASILRATYGVVSKAGISMGADPDTMVLLNAVCWIFGGAAYALVREKGFGFNRKILTYSLLSGVLVFLIIYFLILAIELGEASIVIPIANMSFIVAVLLSVTLRIEDLTSKKILAVGFAVAAILLLSAA